MAPRPTVPGVVWPGWGARLMESVSHDPNDLLTALFLT